MSTITSRGNSLQNVQNYAITDNPVFKIKIRSLATNYEQPSNAKEYEEKEVKVGDVVSGKELETKKIFTGKVIKIDKTKNFIIIIDTETNKKIKLDVKSITIDNVKAANQEVATTFTFEKLLSYKEYLKLNEKY
jgi:hypothetical protein